MSNEPKSRVAHNESLNLEGTILRIADTSLYHDAGLNIHMPPGRLSIYRLIEKDDEWIGIDIVAVERFEEVRFLGEVDVEFSQFGIFDCVRMNQFFASVDDADVYIRSIEQLRAIWSD